VILNGGAPKPETGWSRGTGIAGRLELSFLVRKLEGALAAISIGRRLRDEET